MACNMSWSGDPRGLAGRRVDLVLRWPDRGNVVARRLAGSAALDQRQALAFGDRRGEQGANAVLLPAQDVHDLGERCTVLAAQHADDVLSLGDERRGGDDVAAVGLTHVSLGSTSGAGGLLAGGGHVALLWV